MATVVSDIRASGGDYATIKAWVDAVNAGTIPGYTAGDTVIGEVTGAVDLGASSSNVGLSTTGPAEVILRAAAGQKHTGTPATGATIAITTSYALVMLTSSRTFTIQDLEIVSSHSGSSGSGLLTVQYGTMLCDRCLIQGNSVYQISYLCLAVSSGMLKLQNSILTAKGGAVSNALVYLAQSLTSPAYLINCTLDGGTRGVYSIYKTSLYMKNCIVMNTTTDDIRAFSGAYPAFTDYNATEDASAPGTNSLTNLTRANQYVDPANYDFHLLSTADLVGAGFDLGTTYNSEKDIDEYDRDAGGVVWDIGADQYVAGGGGGIVVPVAVSHLRQQGIM